jgi:hypothetical protein
MKLSEVLSEKIKPKEKVDKITFMVLEEPSRIKELMQNFVEGSDVEKGTYATVMKHVSEKNPEIIEPYIEDLFDYINHKSNRVKWGIPETIGNLAENYPIRVENAIPSLLVNTKDKSTVVRWCAAYALSRIMIHNSGKRDKLLEKIDEILSQEKNNGVRNVYLNAIKRIQK